MEWEEIEALTKRIDELCKEVDKELNGDKVTIRHNRKKYTLSGFWGRQVMKIVEDHEAK